MSQGLHRWVRTVAYCENERSAQNMLMSRMYRGEIDRAPIWDDVRTLRGTNLPTIDIVSGGFPCTDISLAGAREGLGAERSGLFWEVVRLTEECQPAFVFLENVWPGVRRYIRTIRTTFEGSGFRVRDGHLAASDIGARHQRERWFMLAAHPDRIAKRIQSGGGLRSGWKETLLFGDALENGILADADGSRVEKCGVRLGLEPEEPFSIDLLEGNTWDERAAFLLRMDHGLPNRGDRLRALGNSVPPKQYEEAFKRLIGLA